MKVNSSKVFRRWFKKKANRLEVDENFMGYGYDEGHNHTHGFFNLVHGDKEDLEGYLLGRLDLAQDNQAIYEFVQNAADCKSTHFYSFWNDEFFLVCNNGDKFTYSGIKSILNEGQSYKPSDSIGRYGVGFKIVHRLVGKDNGLQEIMHRDCGPLLFSWSKKEDFFSFMNGNSIELSDTHDEAAPYLMKILLTNFPSDPEEVVYDSNHERRVVFQEQELKDCQSYIRDCLEKYYNEDNSIFAQGSVFFLRLGEGKKEGLDNDYAELKEGLSYSMNTLKGLNSIVVNDESILRKKLNLEEGVIAKNTEIFNKLSIEPKYREYDVRYSFGYIPFENMKDLSDLENLKKSPNFYKFFPISDEINKCALFLHCDTFGNSTSRRSLDRSEHNRLILGEIAGFIMQRMEKFKQLDATKFAQLFAAILLSDRPVDSNNSWMDDVFYQPLLAYIRQNTPTNCVTYRPAAEVKIKGTNLAISPKEVGANYDWFVYDNDKDNVLQNAAIDTKHLGLQVKDIKGLIKDGTIELWNKWIEGHPTSVNTLLDEIKDVVTSDELKAKLKQLKLFTLSSGEKCTWQELSANKNLILSSDSTIPIKDVLEKLGFDCTTEVLNDAHPLQKHLSPMSDLYIWGLIKSKLDKETTLSQTEKVSLVCACSKFKDVGPATIGQVKLFHNLSGVLTPLKDMLPFDASYPQWLGSYVIENSDYSSHLDTFLIPYGKIFEDVVVKNYRDIISTIDSDQKTAIETLFSYFKDRGWTTTFTDKLLVTYGADEKLLSIIEVQGDKQEIYLRKLLPLKLDVNKEYSLDSFEYRILKLSVNNEKNTEILKGKISIGDKKLGQYTVTDTITIKQFKGRTIADFVMNVSDILPNMKSSDEFSKIAAKFPKASGLFTKSEMSVGEVFAALKADNGYFSNAQRLFLMLRAGYLNHEYVSPALKFKDVNDYIGFVDYLYKKAQQQDQLYDIIDAYSKPYNSTTIYISAFPYTTVSERADSVIESWVENNDAKLSFLKRFGYKDSSCEELKRRKAFINKDEQDCSQIPTSNMAFLDWVITQQCPFDNANQVEVLTTICKKGLSYAHESVDIERLQTESIEWKKDEYREWSAQKGVKIFLFKGEIPFSGQYKKQNQPSVKLYEKEDGKYYLLNYKRLYISNTVDVFSTLAIVAGDSSITSFTKEDLNTIFGRPTDVAISLAKENELLKSENEELRRLLAENQATMSGTRGEGISTSQQKEESLLAKNLVLEHLSSKGFDVSHVNYELLSKSDGVIDRVEKDGIHYPLVVKSCKNWEHRLFIDSKEWKQLFKPNSMLWLHFGNRVVAPIKSYELFSYQDKLTLSFDTKNLMNDERVNKIMEVMRYFNSVHLDLATLSPDTHRGDSLDDYLFNSNNAENSDLTPSP